MMKAFCDTCNKEITPKEMTGNFMYFEKNWVDAIKKGTDKSIVKKELIFCESCLDDIKTYIAKNQKEQSAVNGQNS